MALYSASAEDRDTVLCFLDFQEISESPTKTQNPIVERLVSGHVPQSESAKAFNCIEDSTEKENSLSWCPFYVL